MAWKGSLIELVEWWLPNGVSDAVPSGQYTSGPGLDRDMMGAWQSIICIPPG